MKNRSNNQQVPHKQHYVWRAYLKPWCTCINPTQSKYTIWWNNKKAHRCTDLYDILREKDCYEFKSLNKLELLLLEKLFVSKNTDCWVGEANGFVFDLACLVATVKKEWSGSSTVLHEQLVVLGERMQSDVEKMGMAPLKKLHNNDLSFLDDEGEKLEFLYFLCTQYFRTKGLKDEVRDDMGKESYRIIECFQKELGDECDYSIDWSALYNYGCYCLALSCASSLLKNDIHFKLLLSQKTRFIVSDQPVYNSGNHLEGELRFFYPISPYQAVIGSTEFLQNEVIEIGDSDVLLHNDNTLKHTYKFFMGKEESDVNFDYPY